jgi:hypothetical protein
MASERVAHARAKLRMAASLLSAAAAARVPCEVFGDGMIARTKDGAIIQHGRAEDGGILTRIVREAPVVLDPPGITLHGLLDP